MRRLLFMVLILVGVSYSQQTYTGAANTFKAVTDTVGASWVDTLSRKVVSSTANNLSTIVKATFGVSIVSDDTIEVSTSASFTAGASVIVLPNLPFSTGQLVYGTFTNLYIRRYSVSGAVGTPRYYLYFAGL